MLSASVTLPKEEGGYTGKLVPDQGQGWEKEYKTTQKKGGGEGNAAREGGMSSLKNIEVGVKGERRIS